MLLLLAHTQRHSLIPLHTPANINACVYIHINAYFALISFAVSSHFVITDVFVVGVVAAAVSGTLLYLNGCSARHFSTAQFLISVVPPVAVAVVVGFFFF